MVPVVQIVRADDALLREEVDVEGVVERDGEHVLRTRAVLDRCAHRLKGRMHRQGENRAAPQITAEFLHGSRRGATHVI